MADDPSTYENWVAVFNTSTDYEADLVRDRLDAAGVPAVVLTQRDHAFTDAELEQAALDADPDSEDAHTADEEGMLDSGPDSLRFSAPEDDDPVKK